jgi:gamma-glutamyltranspeptidase/glutathione hydrolase
MESGFATRPDLRERRGAVATSHYLATEVGMATLRAGGNAADAIVSAAAVLNVIEPMNSHLGGDVFALYWDAQTETLHAINSSGAAPEDLQPELFRGDVMPDTGYLCSTVPGQIAGWELLLDRFGSRDVADLLDQAIYYAEEGFPVGRMLAQSLAQNARLLARFPSSAEAFLPDGRPFREGETLRQPDLARTLRRLADAGLRDFYEGELAQLIVDAWQSGGGVLKSSDLAGYRAELLEPLQTSYRGYTVAETPPDSQGHILLQSLQMVEHMDLTAMGHLSPEAMHVCIEANKLAHADKNRYTTDPRFSPFPTGLLSTSYAAERAALIRPDQAADFPPAPGCPPGGTDTTYLCAVDAQGNAVSYIQSVFNEFGCGVVADGTGVLLNNRGSGFSLDPMHVNFLQPSKRTVHSLNCWMLLRNGKPVVLGGSPGADVQVQTNLQLITGLIDFSRSPQQAAEDPRWTRGEERSVSIESRVGKCALEGLQTRGHQVTTVGPWGHNGRVQLIQIEENGILTAGSDPRCDGCALVF